MKTNEFGLPVDQSREIVQRLNKLLADFQVYYQNLRGVHWNIRGHRFFELHIKFEELYNDAQQKVDDLAERILTLGETPIHTLEDYTTQSKMLVGKNVKEDVQAVKLILGSIKILLQGERQLLDLSGKINDEGTNAMMSTFISEQEKTVWMMKAWLNEEV